MIMTGFVASLALSACGSGGPRQDASEPKGKFPVAVDSASFPSAQTLSQHARLTIAVRNSGSKTIPNIAVTICNVTCTYPASTAQGSAQAFSQDVNAKYLANPSRPVWIVDQPPGVCGYSCANGGQGAGVTAYTNTWALGPLKPGKTANFAWKVTAVSPGRHVVAWEVAAGLNGRARAVVSGGGTPHGTFSVDISSKPARNYVNNSGQIVSGSGQP
ncbi:MAG TPA: hypothetical protein VGG87_01240 [Solirubrobacteraceae bacterium]